MGSPTRFRPYELDQLALLPADMKEWLPEDDLVYFVLDVVGRLDLSAIYGSYDGSQGGQPPYDPRLMVNLLLYGYCVGVVSSRQIEKATYHSVPFRILSAGQHPDHDTIAAFRQRHLEALAGLFVQGLRLCQKAGLVKLGHVSLDGTKVQANASKHKAMSYGRMEKKASELRAEVEALLAQAEAVDAEEDGRYGQGQRGDELPEELRFKQSRLAKIEAAMEALEAEALAEAEAQQPDYEAKKAAWEERGQRGRPPKEPSPEPEPKRQHNFTDSESRIMPSGKSFVQGYNCQIAVDEEAQVIVAAHVTQHTNDKQELVPLLEELKANTDGQTPDRCSADSGYFSEDNIEALVADHIDPYVATGRQCHGEKLLPVRGRIPQDASAKERMARKLRTAKGRATYSKRKHIAEPPFGQIKEARGFRRFSLRGLVKVGLEWDMVCLTHNLLKLFRSGWVANPA